MSSRDSRHAPAGVPRDELEDVRELGWTLYALVVGDLPRHARTETKRRPSPPDYAAHAKARNLQLPREFLATIQTLCADEPTARLHSLTDVYDRLYYLERILCGQSK